MAATSGARRRRKITATVDPELLASVDAYIAAHPNPRRSAVIEQALRLWRSRLQERAMEMQFANPDGVDPDERQDWERLRRTAVARQLATEN